MINLITGAATLGVHITQSQAALLDHYRQLLVEKNKVMNLTAITEKTEVEQLHFLDSLALLTLVDFKNSSVADVGTGAGFPGLPMKIAEPTISLTLLDAQRKRIDFLTETVENLKLDNITCLHRRAEECGDMRESFDFAVSRAVAKLNVLCELCVPLVKVGGCFISMKSVDSDEEISNASSAIKQLGCRLEKKADYLIPGTEIVHRGVIIRKIESTPKKYPRRFAKIQSEPL